MFSGERSISEIVVLALFLREGTSLLLRFEEARVTTFISGGGGDEPNLSWSCLKSVLLSETSKSVGDHGKGEGGGGGVWLGCWG